MTKHILICTIARGCVGNLETWYNQLADLSDILYNQGYTIELSVAENDSTDGTAEWLRNRRENWIGAPCPGLKAEAFHLSTDTLGTTQYPSVWNVDRIKNLAAARNRCLDIAGDLSRFQKIVYAEVDVTYDPIWIVELILANHPRAAGLGDCPDVYSGWSLRSLAHPKESTFLYDCCALRARPTDLTWDFVYDGGGTWRGDSLVPTGLLGFEANSLHRVWSTFNCFCVYNAKPFVEGLRWDYVNPRLNTGQPYIEGRGWLDSDTSVLCEAFRARGYFNILLNTNRLIRHA